MKRKNIRNKAYRGQIYESGPSGLSWFSLAFSWLMVIPIAFGVFHKPEIPLPLEEPVTETVFAASAIPEQELQKETVSVLMHRLPAVCPLRSEEPTILIYHTHTTEAYTQTAEETYQESSGWRTYDTTKNVVAVGERLKEILEVQYGYHVLHDTTDHEPPKLATAYERSLKTMERYHQEYPSIVLFIDLHRDAYDTSNAPCDYLTVDGTETARLMLVVGKGEKYADKPYYDSNIAFAKRITEHLNKIMPKLCRPVREKAGRYNQHVAPNCILVEVGHNANTLSQAMAAMPYLAESIVYAFRQEDITASAWAPN